MGLQALPENLFAIAHLLASGGFRSFGEKEGEYFDFLSILRGGENMCIETGQQS